LDIYGILNLVADLLATILATWVIALIARMLVGQLMSRSMPLVAAQARRAVFIVVWVIGAIIAAQLLGVPSETLLLFVALFGIGAVVALRDPLENLAARYFSDVYVPFKIGDSILVQGQSGRVIEVNPMATVLLAKDDSLVSIPNALFLKETVVNTTPHAWKEVAIPMVVGTEVDLPAFESAILKSCNKLRLHLDERFPPILTVKSRTTQSTELLLTVMIRDPGERDAIVTEINKRVAEMLGRVPGVKKLRTPA
jgi:small conductance mechanosensitive channel